MICSIKAEYKLQPVYDCKTFGNMLTADRRMAMDISPVQRRDYGITRSVSCPDAGIIR